MEEVNMAAQRKTQRVADRNGPWRFA